MGGSDGGTQGQAEIEARLGWQDLGRLFWIRHRYVVLGVWDGFCWAAALLVAMWARFEFTLKGVDVGGALLAMPIVVITAHFAGLWQGLYQGQWKLASFEEVAGLLKASTLTMAILFCGNLGVRWVPVSVPLITMFVAMAGMGTLRYAWRLTVQQRRRPDADQGARALVFGAGEGAEQLLTAALTSRDCPYVPVVIVDDDPGKQRLRIRGVPVEGTRADIAELAARHRCDVLVVAIPSADSALLRELADLAVTIGLQVAVVPRVEELLGGEINFGDIRPLTEQDLLGRHPADIDIDSIANYLTNRVVLVTGAGGSIGSELCRQITRFGPRELVMVDHDESLLHACELSLDGRGQLTSPNLVVASIRDRDRMLEVFQQWEPDVVFHAAALKHVPLLEQHPQEAMKTNVWGTYHCLEAAASVGVGRFVNISTDKAADPINVLGRTKRIAEQLTAGMHQSEQGTFVSVRFGNVLGSRGSVLTIFQSQIDNGGPVTVTHPDVTRYFMTVQEAVQLVIQAGAIGTDGEVMVLDMGVPVRIADVAERLVAAAPRKGIEIIYTGLRHGEKLHEVLLGDGEVADCRIHPRISHVSVPPLFAPPALEPVLDRT